VAERKETSLPSRGFEAACQGQGCVYCPVPFLLFLHGVVMSSGPKAINVAIADAPGTPATNTLPTEVVCQILSAGKYPPDSGVSTKKKRRNTKKKRRD